MPRRIWGGNTFVDVFAPQRIGSSLDPPVVSEVSTAHHVHRRAKRLHLFKCTVKLVKSSTGDISIVYFNGISVEMNETSHEKETKVYLALQKTTILFYC